MACRTSSGMSFSRSNMGLRPFPRLSSMKSGRTKSEVQVLSSNERLSSLSKKLLIPFSSFPSISLKYEP